MTGAAIIENPTGLYMLTYQYVGRERRELVWELISAWKRGNKWFGYYFHISEQRYRQNQLKYAIRSRLKCHPLRPRLPR